MDSCEDHDLVFSSSGEKVDGKEEDVDKKVVECVDTCEKHVDEYVVEEKIVESVDTSGKQDSEDVVVESIDTSDKQDVVESDDLCSVEFDISKKQAIVEDTTMLTLETPKEEKQVYPLIIEPVSHANEQESASNVESTEVEVIIGPGELERVSNDDALTEVGATNTSSKTETVEHVGELSNWGNKPNSTSHRVVENVRRQPIVQQSRDNDEKIGENIGFALLEIDEMNRKRDAIRKEVETKRITSKEYRDKYEAAKSVQSVAYDVLNAKRKELDSVQSRLNMIKNALKVKETGDKVRAIQHKLEHETIYSIQEEKQLMRELKQFTAYHQQLRSIVERQTEPQPSSDEIKSLEKRLKALKEELDSAKKELSRIKPITNSARKVYFDENEKLKEMQGQFKPVNMICQEAYANVLNLKRQLNKNKYFRMYKDDDFKNKYLMSNPTSTHALNAVRRKVEDNKVVAPTEIKPALHSQKMLKEENKHGEEEEELPREDKVLPKENVMKSREELVAEERTKAKEAEERKKRNAEKAKARAQLMEQKEAERKAKRDRKKARKAGIIEGESLVPNSEDLSLEPVNEEIPEISEKPTMLLETKKKPRSKKCKKPSVFGKTNVIAPSLPNKKKKPTQLWKWVIFSALLVVVACLADPLRILL